MNLSQDLCCLYILKLTKNKYYVGKVKKIEDVERRLKQHVAGGEAGAQWTTLYEPLSVEHTFPNSDIFAEDALTLKMMHRYGIENVRGGSYSMITLTASQINGIERLIRGATNQCLACGSTTHFVRDCPHSTKVENAIVKKKVSSRKPKVNGAKKIQRSTKTKTIKSGKRQRKKAKLS